MTNSKTVLKTHSLVLRNEKPTTDEAWQRIIVIKGKRAELQREIDALKPQAVRELRALGFSFDNIARTLMVGKVTAIRMFKEGK